MPKESYFKTDLQGLTEEADARSRGFLDGFGGRTDIDFLGKTGTEVTRAYVEGWRSGQGINANPTSRQFLQMPLSNDVTATSKLKDYGLTQILKELRVENFDYGSRYCSRTIFVNEETTAESRKRQIIEAMQREDERRITFAEALARKLIKSSIDGPFRRKMQEPLEEYFGIPQNYIDYKAESPMTVLISSRAPEKSIKQQIEEAIKRHKAKVRAEAEAIARMLRKSSMDNLDDHPFKEIRKYKNYNNF